MAIKAKYLGDGTQFLHGVPARDLEDGDWARFSEKTRALIKNSGLYEVSSSKKKKATKDGDD